MYAVITPNTNGQQKFICTVGAQVLGHSKHKDYFEYHLLKKDIKKLEGAGIDGFVYLNADKSVEAIRSPNGRSINPKVATRALKEALQATTIALASSKGQAQAAKDVTA